jgi:hypothetical protein
MDDRERSAALPDGPSFPLVAVLLVEGPRMWSWGVQRIERVEDVGPVTKAMRARCLAALHAQGEAAIPPVRTVLTWEPETMAALEAESHARAGSGPGPVLLSLAHRRTKR